MSRIASSLCFVFALLRRAMSMSEPSRSSSERFDEDLCSLPACLPPARHFFSIRIKPERAEHAEGRVIARWVFSRDGGGGPGRSENRSTRRRKTAELTARGTRVTSLPPLRIRGRPSGRRLWENANVVAGRDRRFRAGSSEITAISIRHHYVGRLEPPVVRSFRLSSGGWRA
jgi:hypothetical protein